MSESDAERLVRIETKLDHLIQADEDVKTRVTKVDRRVDGVEKRVRVLETTSAGDRVRWSMTVGVGTGALGVGTAIGAAVARVIGA